MVDLDVRGNGGTRRVVPEDVTHVVQQARGRQQDIGRLLFAALHAFHEKFRVGVAVIPRRRPDRVAATDPRSSAPPLGGCRSSPASPSPIPAWLFVLLTPTRLAICFSARRRAAVPGRKFGWSAWT